MLFSSARYPFLRVKISSADEFYTPNGALKVRKRSRYAEFQNGSFETQNVETIEALVNHPAYNQDFYGPFSRADVVSGDYKTKLPGHIKTLESDKREFDVSGIAAQGAKNSAGPQVASHSIDTNTDRPVVKPVKVEDILARQKEIAKEEKK